MMINSIGRELGVEIPNEFNGINEDDYPKFWEEFPDHAKLTFVSYIFSLGRKIEIHKLFPSDLVLFKDGAGLLGAGIYAGNSLILASFVGYKISLVRRENYPIEVVVRWVVNKAG